jgi:hypothetical protein
VTFLLGNKDISDIGGQPRSSFNLNPRDNHDPPN